MLGNDVKYKRKKYGARGAQIDLAHGRCSHYMSFKHFQSKFRWDGGNTGL